MLRLAKGIAYFSPPQCEAVHALRRPPLSHGELVWHHSHPAFIISSFFGGGHFHAARCHLSPMFFVG
jgi:hypothetical protein